MIDLVAGDELEAPWGRYRFLRYDGSHAVLQDRSNPSAFVVPHVEHMAEYSITRRAAAVASQLVSSSDGAALSARCNSPSQGDGGTIRPSLVEETPGPSRGAASAATSAPSLVETSSRRGVIGTATTLGALQPSRGYISLPAVELLYWAPCFTRAPDGAEAHAWFITSNQAPKFRCPACRELGAAAAPPPREQKPPPVNETPVPVNTPAPAPTGPELPWGAAQPLWAKPGAEDLEEVWRERAAIREFLGLEARAVAERLAYYELVRIWGRAA